MHSQRALTEMAGERVAEMLSWRTADSLSFAIVIWPRGPEGKATTYVSSNDAELAVKLSALIGDHQAGDAP
jgi:hypothetical protein